MMNEECTLWSTVFFRVEDTIFQVPQHRFTEHSDVFADMFLMPQAGDATSVEGKDKEHPILLESYKAADFKALVKLLYPLPEISGSYSFTRDEWVGALNLSTRWHMRKMRDYAIRNLSKMSLTSFEKVTLARDHQVAKWLKEGLNEIGTNKNVLIAVFGTPRNCHSCTRKILPDDREAIYLCDKASVLVQDVSTSGPMRTQFLVKLADLRCRHCSKCPLICQYNSGYGCPSSRCGNIVLGSGSFRLLLADGAPQKAKSDEYVKVVNEVFKEEIASYESWDQ
ncbi:hypothetical protein EST38_g11248 [Candolleomyces aberdarensis]|uniref:BTB domain-containing protein n=1 Tax=Candolleomyces aberdarensis TaxID=2316362 RepID=A0A4Q2D7N7_9AGAR|nr:hypothetical protein EST38_g11248 [Candolleomyces aberdarensis]